MYFLVLKHIHPKGTRTSSEGISTNYRSARVEKQTGRFLGHLMLRKQLQEHLILQLLFLYTNITFFMANELRATPCS